MKRFYALFALVLTTSTGFALDLNLNSSMTNIFWSGDRKADTAGLEFKGADLFYSVDGWISQEIGDGLGMKAGFSNDMILRKKAFADIFYKFDNFTFTVGPFFSTFNTVEKWFNPGILAAFQMDIPGWIFLKVGFQSNLGGMSKVGEFIISDQFATAGLYLPNGIITGGMRDRSFQQTTGANATVIDSLTDFNLSTEVFEKNFPVRYAFDMRYQILNRSYQAATVKTSPVHSILLDNKFTWETSPGLSLYGAFGFNLLSFGTDSTVYSVPKQGFLYTASLGMKTKL